MTTTAKQSSRATVKTDRAILVGVGIKPEGLAELKESLAELSDLAEGAGAEVVGFAVQILPSFNAATLIGTGKVDEIKEMVTEAKATVVIIDHQLSGVQGRNLKELLGVDVVDRTQLILDIFAIRAQSHEGKLQVELAQLLDQSTRMVGGWLGSLSRQGGGIGTRGPGEKAIETDRRHIRDRITRIRRELEQVRKHRSQHRARRRQNKIPSFALIGYTNTGKSTLLNSMTNAQVLAQDQLFATLDPTTRKVFIPGASPAVVTDTVGFIRKLPTKLIEAFKATLEETAEADVLLHVIDISNPNWEQQVGVVDELIREFGWESKPIIHIFNKMDKTTSDRKFMVKVSPRVFMSAVTGEGMLQLIEEMKKTMQGLSEEYQLYFDHRERYKIFDLARETQITRQEEGSQGVVCYAHLTPQLLSKWKDYLINAHGEVGVPTAREVEIDHA